MSHASLVRFLQVPHPEKAAVQPIPVLDIDSNFVPKMDEKSQNFSILKTELAK
jgi:hypothetical protein